MRKREFSRDFSISEMPAPAGFAGKPLKELQLRRSYGLTVVAFKRMNA